MAMNLIPCSTNFGIRNQRYKTSYVNIAIDKRLIKDIPDNESCASFENKASVDDMIIIQRLCRKGVSKENIIKQFNVKYKIPDIEKYIERCMK